MTTKAVFAVSCLTLAGCSTTSIVTSTELQGTAPAVLQGASGVYGVGRSSVQVTMSLPDESASGDTAKGNTTSRSADGGKDDAAGAKKEEGAADAVKPADAAKAGKSALAAATQPTSCKDLRTAYRSNRFAYLRFLADTEGLLDRIDDLADDGSNPVPISDGEIQPVIAGLQTFIKNSPAAFQIAHVEAATYDLIESECPTPIKVDLKHVVDADPSRMFKLTLKINDFASDQLTLKTDEAGLPVLIETSADDQTGTFLTSLATSIGTIVGIIKPIPLPGGPGDIVVTGSRIIRTHYVALSLTDLTTALGKAAPQQRPLILSIAVKRIRDSLPDTPEPIDPKLPSAAQTYLISDLERAPIEIADGVALRAVCGIGLPAAAPSQHASDGSIVLRNFAGIVASLPRPCTVRVNSVRRYDPPAKPEDLDPLDTTPPPTVIAIGDKSYALGPDLVLASVVVLDSRSLFVVPVERTSLVKRTAHIEFAAGRVVNTQYTRPSPAVAMASLPGNIIGGFFGGIIGGITGRTNSVKAETDLVNAKASMLAAQAAYKKAVADAKPDTTSN